MIDKIQIAGGNLRRQQRRLHQWQVPASTRREIQQFLHDLELGKVNRGLRISERRRLKYLSTLRIPLEFLNKPTPKLTLKDIERFETALASGSIAHRRTGQPYRHSTQVDIRKLFRIFLRWRLGQAKTLTLAGWLDTRPRLKTPECLTEVQVEKLYRACTKPEHRFLIAALFDSGARAEEFHNIRFEDVHLPEGKAAFVKLTLKEEYSKTLGRTVALYWKHSLEAVGEFVRQRLAQGIQPTDPLFNKAYPAARKFLQRLGQRVLGRSLHYHLFRHSSATYYATKLNRQELCYRYGWRFSSNMPDIYISRSGMATQQLDEKFTQTELSSLKTELTELREQERIKEQRVQQLQNAVNAMAQSLQQVSEVLQVSNDPHLIKAALEQIRRRNHKA
jgi:integrase